MCSVTFSPAINAAFTSAFTASRALFAWSVQRNPQPALIARGQLERLGAAHLADDDPVRPHRQHELDEVAQADLAGAVETRPAGPRSTRRAAPARRARGSPRSCARNARSEPPTTAPPRAWSCPRRALPRPRSGCAAASSPTGSRRPAAVNASRADERVEGHVAHRVAPDGRRELVGDGLDRGRQPRRSVEDARLDERMLRVELALGRGEQPVDDLAVLLLGRRLGEPVQPTVSVEVRDPGALRRTPPRRRDARAARSTGRAR